MSPIVRKSSVVVLCVLIGALSVNAQSRDSFEEFRKGIKSDFETFRKKILDDYDKYLEGIWTEYQAFRGIERNPLPKPKRPTTANPDNRPPSVDLPEPTAPQPQPGPQNRPKQPNIEPLPAKPVESQIAFDFYGISVSVSKTGLEQDPTQWKNLDYADLWRLYSKRNISAVIVPAMQQIAEVYTLNDWFLFELVRSYVAGIFPSADARMRTSMVHYLLNHLDYDVRVGEEVTGQPILLVAFEQLVYGRSFTEIDGQRYYLFYDSFYRDTDRVGAFKTCALPHDADKGRALDLVIHEALTIPYTPHAYAFRYGDLEISGEMNVNLMPMLYRYPQMPIGCYTLSKVDDKLRENVVMQIRQQLENIPQHQAVDRLLQFVQSAFEYATDDEQHGFEKPYFFEEMLFYPKCDCEDRAIFYSYLLWNALRVENQMIGYPGHEAVAVHLDALISGDGYMYEGKKFYISDPTYIGAVTGMCMPDFRSIKPEIDCYRYFDSE